MTDKRIIKLFIDRDEDALREVMNKYGALCLEIAKDNMPSTEEAEECVNEALLELWHHVADDLPRDLPAYISETVLLCARGEKRRSPLIPRKTRRKIFIAFSAAALIACLIPAILLLPQKAPAEDTLPEESTSLPVEETSVEKTPVEETTAPQLESDGTEGLLYEIAEDGKSARFIGFGDCREETVVIANTYGGLPVREMIIGEIRDILADENAKVGDFDKYGSAYLKHLVISDTVEIVGNEIISSCANIESVYYGKNVRDIGKYWHTAYYTHKNFSTLEVSPDNEYYYSIGNCIIEKSTKTLVRGCTGSVIPDDGSVEIISEKAFSFIKGLTSVTVPESVKIIERRAFFSCNDLQSVCLPKNLQTLGEEAFYYCNRLKSVDLNGLEKLPKSVFNYCSNLAEVKGAEKLTEIGESAFEECRELKLALGKSLKKIGKYAFVNVPNNPTYEGTKAEWEAVEKERFWCLYTRHEVSAFKWIKCSDGNIASGATIIATKQ